jgi:cytochrome P450
MWYVTCRDDVIAVLNNPDLFTVQHSGSVLRRILGYNMLTTDGDEQRRLRKPFLPTFAANAIRRNLSTAVEQEARCLINTFRASVEADLIASFADPLALIIVTAALGLPIHDFAVFRGWYNDFNAALGNFVGDSVIEAHGQMAKTAFADYVLAHLAALRAFPDDTVLSQIASSGEISDMEIVDAARVITFGGLETTAALLGNVVWALLTHPDQFALVQRDPALIKIAIEEAFRWESPVQTCTRHVTQDTILRGVNLRAGDALQCMLGAANRDPDYFDEPDTFDIQRANAQEHLGFGTGKHFCIGSALARLEASIGLPLLFEYLPDLKLLNPDTDHPEGHEFRSPARLRVTWNVE